MTKEKIKHFSILFFSLFLTLAVFSQISAASPKPTYDVGLNKADWLYYKTSNDLSAYLGKKSSTLPTVRYQKGGDYLEFSLNNVSSTTSVSLETNTKAPNTPTLFYRNILDGVDANYQITNIPFKVKEEIVLKKVLGVSELGFREDREDNENLTPTTYNLQPTTFLFSAETTGKPVKQKDGSIAFFDENGEYLFQLDKPFMIDAKGIISNDVSIEIKPTSDVGLRRTNKTKIASEETIFGDSNLERNSDSRLPPIKQFNGIKRFVKDLNNKYVDNKKVLDLGGIEPPDSQVATWSPRQARPRTESVYQNKTKNEKIKNQNHNSKLKTIKPQFYQIVLKADTQWLNSSDRVYPVVIDPTVAHNADANFTGQFNRIADSDTTSSTQLESSYPEATKDPYTVLLLHFNEANGTTVGITDMASSTRVITANGNASTTNYVTQLGMGNSAAFDGTGDYFSAPGAKTLSGFSAFTATMWINQTAIVGGDVSTLVSNNVGGGPYNLYVNTSSQPYWYLVTANGIYNTTSSVSMKLGQWYHLAYVYDGSNIYIYVNGTLTGTAAASGVMNTGSDDTKFTIGIRSDTLLPFNGYIDDLHIAARALTPEEIKAAASRRPYAVYTSPVLDASANVAWNTVNWTEGGVATGNGEQSYSTNSLVAQWDFNETSGTTLTASSSGSCTTACNGALTNFAYTASQDQATTTTGWTANNKKWGAGALMMESAASADYVSIADPASNVLDPNSADLTIETWLKTSDTSAEIFSNNNANGTACASNGYYLGIDASGYPVFYLDTNGATAGCDASTTSQFKINDGNWHKVSVSVTRGTSAVIYVDGKLAGSDTSVTSYSATTVIGTVYFGGSAGGLDAILDSTRFYSRALSASEILSNYNAGNIEIQTRTGATSDPNDGTWEAWKPTTGETQLFSLDSDAANWHSDIMASTTIATSTEIVIKAEGTGSLKIRTGMASTTAGTVALWHMEETGTTTGTTLYDSTANANNVTTIGTPSPVDGIFGKARKFKGAGSSDCLRKSGSNDFVFAGDFSVDMWMKTTATTEMGLFGTTNEAVWTSDAWAFEYLNSTLFFFRNGSTVLSVNSGNLHDNNWHHVAIVRNGSTVALYADGIQRGTVTDSTTIGNATFRVVVGSYEPTCGGNSWNGNLDEARVIKGRAISADEIAETFRMGANHHLTRQVSAADLSAQTKIPFWIAADRNGTFLEAMIGESDYANYELASSTLAISTTTVLYIKGDEIASSTSIKDSSFSGKAITANGNARTAGGGKIGNAISFDGTGDYLGVADSDDWAFGAGDFSIDFWTKFDGTGYSGYETFFMHGVQGGGNWYYFQWTNSGGEKLRFYTHTGGPAIIQHDVSWTRSLNTWYHIALVRSGNNFTTFVNGLPLGTTVDSDSVGNYTGNFAVGENANGPDSYFGGLIDEFRIIKGTALTPDQIRQAYEYGLRNHPITIDFGATLQPSDLISSATDYNFSITATTSGASATTTGLYLGDKIIVKENLGGTEYTAQGTVNSINTTTGAITVPSWDTGSTFPSSNGYSPSATVFKWQREYFDLTGAATTTRDAITNLTIRPTNGAEGRTIYLDDFRYNTNYLTASSSSAITSSNNRYLQYRAIFSSTDTFVSPFLSAFNTLYTSLTNMFPSLIGVSGGGFLSF